MQSRGENSQKTLPSSFQSAHKSIRTKSIRSIWINMRCSPATMLERQLNGSFHLDSLDHLIPLSLVLRLSGMRSSIPNPIKENFSPYLQSPKNQTESIHQWNNNKKQRRIGKNWAVRIRNLWQNLSKTANTTIIIVVIIRFYRFTVHRCMIWIVPAMREMNMTFSVLKTTTVIQLRKVNWICAYGRMVRHDTY